MSLGVDVALDKTSATSGSSGVASKNRIRRTQILTAAEGYLELQLPAQALRELERLESGDRRTSEALYLAGEALRALHRYREAIPVLKSAAERAPSKLHIRLALGWCYKRVGKIEQAIEALHKALEEDLQEPIVFYNLACYYSLAGQRDPALTHLAHALSLDPGYRDQIGSESDFDSLRADPEFQALTSIVV